MLKFITKKSQHVSAERLKVQKELFAFNKTACHGFPHSPSALAWDPFLELFAIGTKTGSLRVYGAPGVEYVVEHDASSPVVELHFVPKQGRLITLLENNTLHLWEISMKGDDSVLEHVESCTIDAKLRIFACSVQSSGEHLYLGTEGGNIHLLDIKSFQMTDTIIYQDLVTQNVPEDYKINPGGVEAIAEHPLDPNKMVIGYSRGLMVLWDNVTLNADQTYICNKDLHSVSWHGSGTKFMSAHNDCSYFIWGVDNAKVVEAVEQCYGPYPCKAINKILWKRTTGKDDFIIFSGGMPRANYGERHTVSVKHGATAKVLDLTSKVVDFFTVDKEGQEDAECADPVALVVLAEEELVVVDLSSDEWPSFALPCLSSLHSSAITCTNHFANVPDGMWARLLESGRIQAAPCSTKPWPLVGGRVTGEEPSQHDLLVTGHEDGSVRFWDASGSCLRQLLTLRTARLFGAGENTSHSAQDEEEEEEWLHFHKVGTFDPYSDDPRLAVKKVLFCLQTGRLVVAGTAGQVACFTFDPEEAESTTPEAVLLNFVGDRDSFVWKGHDPLQVRGAPLPPEAGFHPDLVLQLSPPAGVTALALRSKWGLIAAGTAHGFGVLDYVQKKVVVSKCTLNPNDLAASGDMMSRRKSFKKSLRESFRRLRKGRSQRGRKDKSMTKSPDTRRPRRGEEEGPSSAVASPASRHNESAIDPGSPLSEAKPVERQVEARSSDDALSSMVRCLCFSSSFILHSAATTPTLWAGTNSGAIFVYTLAFPPSDKRDSDPVQCTLGKEIHLKHKAPVISIHIIDARGYPISDPFEEEPKGLVPPQRVLICSEEQLKVFTLPSLKPFGKLKLTAHEGARLRKAGVARFQSRSDPGRTEYCLAVLSNLGEVALHSLPDLRRQMIESCLRREDINGICSLVFTKDGEGFYLSSPCEFERFSLSAKRLVGPHCQVDLPEGARPQQEPPKAGPSKEETVKPEVEAAKPEVAAPPEEEPPASEAKVEEVSSSSPATSPVSPKEDSSEGAADDDKGGLDSPPDSGISSLVITKNESNFTTTTSTVGDLKSLEMDDLLPADHEGLSDKLRSECKIEVVHEMRTLRVVREETLVNGSSPTS